jgi:hypothetical protein
MTENEVKNAVRDAMDARRMRWQQFFGLEEIEIQSADDKMEAALGCGSCTAQSKDCGACSAELRREIFVEREYKCR